MIEGQQGPALSVGFTADIVSAYVSKNSVPASELPALLQQVHTALEGLGNGNGTQNTLSNTDETEKPTAAQIRKSITHDGIISFLDGKTYKTMKRHLTGYGLNPASYRQKFGLAADYPMVAAGYSEARSNLAKSIGLGQKAA